MQVKEPRKKAGKRTNCCCAAYPWPHRPGGGLCRHPDPPITTFAGKPGKNAPVGMRRRSAIRRRMLQRYGLHPIRDRKKIRRWLPKLYAAYCRRHGYPYPELWMGGYVPAMRITAEGPKASVAPAEQRISSHPWTGYRGWREAMWRDGRKRSHAREERRAKRDAKKCSVAPTDTGETSRLTAEKATLSFGVRGPAGVVVPAVPATFTNVTEKSNALRNR